MCVYVFVWWGDKSLLSKWEFRINSPCSPNLRPEHSLCKPKLKRLFHGDRVYQSNTLFGCTSVYESSPLSLKMKKYGPHLVWIVHVFVIFTEVSLSFHLQGKKKRKEIHFRSFKKDSGRWRLCGISQVWKDSRNRARPCEPLTGPYSPSLWLHPNQLKPYDVTHW